jgi:hypothetical protein
MASAMPFSFIQDRRATGQRCPDAATLVGRIDSNHVDLPLAVFGMELHGYESRDLPVGFGNPGLHLGGTAGLRNGPPLVVATVWVHQREDARTAQHLLQDAKTGAHARTDRAITLFRSASPKGRTTGG